MVDRTNLNEVSALYSEYANVTAALDSLSAGSGVTDVTIGPDNPVTVNTVNWPAPPVERLRQQLLARQQAINAQLVGMGLEGMVAAARTAPAAAPPR